MTTERDIQNRIDFAMDKGREKGRAEGIEKGIERYHTLLYNKTDGGCFGTICFNKYTGYVSNIIS